MADLIDRELLMRALDSQTHPDTVFQPLVVYGINVAKNIVNNMPKVDMQQIQHGQWVKRKDDALIHWDCSCCGIGFLDDTGLDKLRYCPHCGASMDGGRE